MKKVRNINIDGIGSVYGGRFDNVVINGIGKVKGSSEADRFDANGIGKATGNVKAQLVRNTGIFRFRKNVTAKSIENSGVMKIKGDLEACEFISDGIVSIKGSATLDLFKITFFRFSYVCGIYGDTVEIHKLDEQAAGKRSNVFIGPEWLARMFLGHRIKEGMFACKTIECTSLNAEYLFASIVRAQNVTLGPGCVIEHVEYHDSFTADKSSVVKNVTKLS